MITLFMLINLKLFLILKSLRGNFIPLITEFYLTTKE